MSKIRITSQVLRVLNAITSSTEKGGVSGAAVTRATGLASGTIYPILFRLEGAGWLSSEWEEGDPKVLGRPRRRLYAVTAKGAAHARQAAAELFPILGSLATS